MFRVTADNIYYLQDYYPLRSAKHGSDSEAILDFKRGNIGVIELYSRMMESSMQQMYDTDSLKNGYICIMPSHAKGVYSTSLRRLSSYLSKIFEMNDAYDLIVRTKEHEKASTGGERSIASHLSTLDVNPRYSISDKVVIVIDDVTTTGNSIAAARHILKKFNPRQIYAQTLAKTAEERKEPTQIDLQVQMFNSTELTPEESIIHILKDTGKSDEEKSNEIKTKFGDILVERYKVRMYLNEKYGKYGKSFNDSFFDRVCKDNSIYAFVVENECLYTKNMIKSICEYIEGKIRTSTYKDYYSEPQCLTREEAKEYIKEKVLKALEKSRTFYDLRMNLMAEHITISRCTRNNISYLLEGWRQPIRGAGISKDIDAPAIYAKVGPDNCHIVIKRQS